VVVTARRVLSDEAFSSFAGEIATVGIRQAKYACLNRMLSLSNDNLIYDV